MKAGDLDQRVLLLRPTAIRDEALEEIGTFAPAGARWASVRPLSGREPFYGGQVHVETTHEIRLRFVPGLDSTWQVKHQGKVYHILAALDVDSQGVEHRLQCKCG